MLLLTRPVSGPRQLKSGCPGCPARAIRRRRSDWMRDNSSTVPKAGPWRRLRIASLRTPRLLVAWMRVAPYSGPYGRQEGLYLRPPFQSGARNQEDQSEGGPAQAYREGLAAMDRACKERQSGRAFAELSDEKFEFLKALETSALHLDRIDGKSFFAQVVGRRSPLECCARRDASGLV
jgi:Gluconate 2-dehydrogenase subunit 3